MSHGETGELELGSSPLTDGNLAANATVLASVVATGVEISAASNVRLSMLSRALASPEISVPVQRP